MKIIYNKTTGRIEGGLDDKIDHRVYYLKFPQEFLDNLEVIQIDKPILILRHYKIIDGEIVRMSDEEINEIDKYGRMLTDEERQEIINQENQAKHKQEEALAIQSFAKMSFQMTAPTLKPTQILQFEVLVDDWTKGEYKIGDIRKHNGQVWKCVQAHNNANNPDIEPSKSPAHWVFYKSKDVKYAKHYIQPQGAHDAYMKDEYMIFEGKTYKSIIDNNVWNPRDYSQGWKVMV